MSFDADIAAFAAALADPVAPAPAGWEGGRFAVYRNNIAVGLIGSLAARYPATGRLVGPEFFRVLAGAYVAERKPRSAALLAYGADFPAFVRAFAPAREWPDLPDLAALENAWVEAYHAAEAEPLARAALADLAPERWEALRFATHPAARLLRLASPAATLWAASQGEPAPPATGAAEDVLVTRPEADVYVRVLPPGGYDLLSALRAGATLGEAAAPLLARGEDAGSHLVGLIEAGAFAQAPSASAAV